MPFKHVRITCFYNSMCFSHFFFNSINKKTYDSHMLKEHMSFLHVGCRKFPTIRFSIVIFVKSYGNFKVYVVN
jgi:hypothetical protein